MYETYGTIICIKQYKRREREKGNKKTEKNERQEGNDNNYICLGNKIILPQHFILSTT